jgi:hypothetical protein
MVVAAEGAFEAASPCAKAGLGGAAACKPISVRVHPHIEPRIEDGGEGDHI